MKRNTLLTLALLILTSCNCMLAQSAVPDLINYQGHVTDAAGIPLGSGTPVNLDVDFKFFNVATGGIPVYGERQTVTINEGDFSVLIGGGDPIPGIDNISALSGIFSAKDMFLEITVDKDDNGLQDDSAITPRQQIVTTAFAFRSKVAEAVDDLAITEDMVAASSITNAKLSNNSVTTEKIVVSSVISSSIADGTVQTIDLADNSVSTSKIQANAVNGSKIQDETVTGADIKDGTITSSDLANKTLTGSDYADGSVTRAALGKGSVQTAHNDEIIMLRGCFSSNGATIFASEGLTCVKPPALTGVYHLYYSGFSSTPTVVGSSLGSHATYWDNIVSVHEITPTYATIVVIDGGSNGGSAQDSPFNVIIVGPGE